MLLLNWFYNFLPVVILFYCKQAVEQFTEGFENYVEEPKR